MKDADVSKLNLSGWPHPDEYLVEIGRLAAVWAMLEAQLDLYLGKLAGFNNLSDPRPFILLKHSSFPQKVDCLAALCEQLVPDFPKLADYKATVSALKTAQKGRNRYMHNGMSVDPATGKMEMTVGSARGTLKAVVETVTPVEIRRAAVQVNDAMRSLHKLVTGRELAPLSETRAI